MGARRTRPSGRLTGPSTWRRAALAVFLCSTAGSAGSAAEVATVEFIAPRTFATVIGPTTIALQPRVPAGAAIARIDLFVDGTKLASLTAPPWQAAWNAGQGATGHRLEAVLVLAGGESVRAAVQTSPLHIHQVEEVDLVNLYPIVVDRQGRYVTGLGRDDFQVSEEGQPQQIQHFSTEYKPLQVALVLDASNSMGQNDGDKLQSAQRAALEFLELLNAGDQVMLVVFRDEVQIVQELTQDRARVARAIAGLTAHGGTALYDAIFKTSATLERNDGRRVLVLLSDGRDEAYSGLEPGSLHTLQEALDQALRSDVMIFTIGIGRHFADTCVFNMTALSPNVDVCPGGTIGEALERLADSTGGRSLLSPSPSRLHKAFQDVAEALRHQYSIAYAADDEPRDGRWRRIRVSVPGRDVEITAKTGYYAQGAGGTAGGANGK